MPKQLTPALLQEFYRQLARSALVSIVYGQLDRVDPVFVVRLDRTSAEDIDANRRRRDVTIALVRFDGVWRARVVVDGAERVKRTIEEVDDLASVADDALDLAGELQ